jgi:hypothetical protein
MHLICLYLTINPLESHNFLTVTPNLVVLEPMISLRCVEYYHALCSEVRVMLISHTPCLFVLLRVDEQATKDPGTQ